MSQINIRAKPSATMLDMRGRADMVFIPGGAFHMGSDRHYPEEGPAHPVTVDGFLDCSGHR